MASLPAYKWDKLQLPRVQGFPIAWPGTAEARASLVGAGQERLG